GDEVLLHELVSNLVDNAITHGTSGDTITVRVIETAGSSILQVEDNGAGIQPEFQEEALQRFSGNSQSSTQDSNKIRDLNSGLGLSIVSEIANLFQGHISLKTGDGEKGLLVEVKLQNV
ncbi:MAG: ATP-binding protein, partial [Hyphomicrobiales bacterium]